MEMTSTPKHPKIAAFMNSLLNQYKHLRGNPKDDGEMPFWDIVVITASDTAQQTAYQQQLEEKKSRGELPTGLPIHVVSDPPGVRIGNGGSTLTCLEFLHNHYGDRLFEFKILLIHAGGWSQRMPSATVLGKVFSILPHGNPPFQMLDLKLALYWPFVKRIQPGVFLVCADDFLVFDLDDENEWKIPGNGFTALAHPAPLEVGKSHGVFVLADSEKMDTSKPVEICECLKVLQKPSEYRMKNEGAPLKGSSFSFGDGIKLEGDVVYTDSCFYFGVDVMRKLLELKESIGCLSCEIDAYGDFLQAVGKNATNHYINLTFNVSQPTPNLLEMRQKVFDTLNGLDIHVLVLNSSKFIHIGTTKELLHHFCKDEEFQGQLCMGKNVFNQWQNGNIKSPLENSSPENHTENGIDIFNRSNHSCVVHCSLHQNSVLNSDCFLEFCQFEKSITLSSNCILSNCHVSLQESCLQSISVPSDTFLHTVPIVQRGCSTTKYVTIFFHTEDNLKKSTCVRDLRSLPFLGSTIDTFLTRQGLKDQDILPEDQASNENKKCAETSDKEIESSSQKVSLWNLKLYSSHKSMTSSFEEALGIINDCDQKVKKAKLSQTLFSMADLLQLKNVAAMLKFRRDLYERIIKN